MKLAVNPSLLSSLSEEIVSMKTADSIFCRLCRVMMTLFLSLVHYTGVIEDILKCGSEILHYHLYEHTLTWPLLFLSCHHPELCLPKLEKE